MMDVIGIAGCSVLVVVAATTIHLMFDWLFGGRSRTTIVPFDLDLTEDELDRMEVVPFRARFQVRRDPLPRARLLHSAADRGRGSQPATCRNLPRSGATRRGATAVPSPPLAVPPGIPHSDGDVEQQQCAKSAGRPDPGSRPPTGQS